VRSRLRRTSRYRMPSLALLAIASLFSVYATELASVTIEKPKLLITKGGSCRILNGSFSGAWGPSALPTLAFTIGPTPLTESMNANAAKFTGPGKYTNEIVVVYLGKTVREDAYGGLGTVVINPDGRTGTFSANDGSTSGRFDCGGPPMR
jgi:hypothetical protein